MTKEKFWSQYAEHFEELNDYVVGHKDMEIVKSKVAELNNLGVVLEIACGDGCYTNILKDNCSSILATDYSEEMLAVSKKRFNGFGHMAFQQENAMLLSLENNSFDTVFMANILHVVENHQKVVKEAKRVLKQGARIIALDFTLYSMSMWNKLKMRRRFIKTYGIPKIKPSKSTFSTKDMVELLEDNGFKIEECLIIGKKSKAVFAVARKI